MNVMAGLEGFTLGRYYLLERLGSGGMSDVYLAHDDLMNRDVAVKVVSSTHSDYLERFHREAEAIGRLNHDHILPAFDYGDQDPWHYLVMPYIPNATLREVLEEGPLDLEYAGELFTQVASALQFAHDSGIIHRDIKPSNILMRDSHHVYLADFGLAKALDGGNELTQTGALLGTPEYMAPDLSDGPATTSSDIYALGILLYQMITGRVPFVGDTPIATYWKQVNELPVPPSTWNSAISRAIDLVVLKVLEKDPRRRFQSAMELADVYQRALYTPQEYLAEAAPAPRGVDIREKERRFRRVSSAIRSMPYMRPTRRPRSGTQVAGSGNRVRVSDSGDRLVLPGDPVQAPTSVSNRRRRMAIVNESALPPLPMRETNTEGNEDIQGADAIVLPITPAPQGRSRRRATRVAGTVGAVKRRPRPNTRLTISIVALGVLLIIVLPMTVIYAIFVTQHNNTQNVAPTATSQTGQTATQQAGGNTAAAHAALLSSATSGTPFLRDSLTSNTTGRWQQDATHCVSTGNAYQVNVTQANYIQYCALRNITIDDVTAQVDVTVLAGSDAGMVLRVSGEQYYDFEVTSQNQFFFRRHDTGAGAGYITLLPKTTSNAILPAGQKNTLTVIAKGADFKLFINGTFVGESQDGTYATGQFALVAGTATAQNTGLGSFNNLKLFHA